MSSTELSGIEEVRHESLLVLITDDGGGGAIDSGEKTVDDVIAGDWTMARAPAEGLRYLVAIRNGRVSEVRRINHVDGQIDKITEKGRRLVAVHFDIAPSPGLAHLVGQLSPGGPVRNPVQYINTGALLHGDVDTEETTEGQRAVLGGFTFFVADDEARVLAPARARVLVETS